MNFNGVLHRFEANLTINPWIRTESGEREMLADRSVESASEIEMNGVLSSYVCIAMPLNCIDQFPVLPTIIVKIPGRHEAHCMWELEDPVTLTAKGLPGPKKFLKDVEAAALGYLTASCDGGLRRLRALRGLVFCPTNPSHVVETNDVRYSLKTLRQAFRMISPATGGGNTQSRLPHHRSGANAEVFDVTRNQARLLKPAAQSSEQLAESLRAWTATSSIISRSGIEPDALDSLILRVSNYTWGRSRSVISRSTRSRIEQAAREVSKEHRVSEIDALQHFKKPIAKKAGVSEKTIRRALKTA